MTEHVITEYKSEGPCPYCDKPLKVRAAIQWKDKRLTVLKVEKP